MVIFGHLIFRTQEDLFSIFFISVPVPLPILCNHIAFYPTADTRDTETGDPARLPAQLAGQWAQSNWNSVRWEKIFCTGPTRVIKTEQKPIVQVWRVQRKNKRKDPFPLYSLSPNSPQFQQSSQEGPPLSWLSGAHKGTIMKDKFLLKTTRHTFL